jgi:sec-independent protein translocase protein TatB
VFNLGPGEMIVILVAGLVILGPEKLPDMIRKAGRLYGELRRMANGFQSEFREVFEEPMSEFKDTANSARRMFDDPVAEIKETAATARRIFDTPVDADPAPTRPDVAPDPAVESEPAPTTGWEGATWSFDGASPPVTEVVTTGWEGAATSFDPISAADPAPAFDASSPPVVELADGAEAEIRTWGAPNPGERKLPPPNPTGIG